MIILESLILYDLFIYLFFEIMSQNSIEASFFFDFFHVCSR